MDPKQIREQTVRDAKENIILDAARKVFADKGFHDCRLEDIAISSGFSKAALYNYYADKESIFLSLAIRDFDFLIAELNKQVTVDASVKTNLDRLISAALRFFGENFAFYLSLSNFSTRPPCEGHSISANHGKLSGNFHQKFAEILNAFALAVKIGRERGEVTSGIDDQTIAGYISSLFHGVVFSWTKQGKMGDIDVEAKQMVDFACSGICAKRS